MGWHGYWASPEDWQTHHSHHPGHQRNSFFSVSTPVHSPAAGECGLLPQHNEYRIRSRCSRCLTFFLVFTPAALCWWAKNNNNKTQLRRARCSSSRQQRLSNGRSADELQSAASRFLSYTVRQKTAPFLFLNNFVKSRSVLTVFGAEIPEWICNKTVTKIFTSPNECHYTTLWNAACVKLFITTCKH